MNLHYMKPTADIWASEAEYIFVPVNTVGVMGGGLALDASQFYPKECEFYYKVCKAGAMSPGVLAWEGRMLFFPTKEHYRNPSKIQYIRDGLDTFMNEFNKSITLSPTVAIPALGCGLGGLDWAEVLPLILTSLDAYRGVVEIYPPK